MTDESQHPAPRKNLTVLPHSGKVDQIREELRNDTQSPDKPLVHQTLIDRAIDPSKTSGQKAIEEKVIAALRTVFDPEIPVNIYDLGLIYEVKVSDDARVEVKMTLTAPACPVAGTLPPEVEQKIENIDEVTSAKVELVWDPPWSRDRMSEEALLELGLL